jgi:heme-degrading monooxygenase HmoA
MIHELRTYRVFEHNRAAFLERFLEEAAPRMRRYGFTIEHMWFADDAGPLFVYLLAWDDENAMQAAWKRFMADEEWIAVKKETAERHGDLVATVESRVLRTI